MARSVRDSNLETRAARLRLAPRPEPYWRLIESGLHLGYRRRARGGGGAWVARRFKGKCKGERAYDRHSIGTADDLCDADGETVRTFQQAQFAARTWWQDEQRKAKGGVASGPFTVAMALEAYFADRRAGLIGGSKGLAKDRASATARIMPTLGAVELSKLTTRRIRDWLAALATAPRFPRAARFTKPKQQAAFDATDPDKVRARRSTANRTLTVLKAALNHAVRERHAAADNAEAWREVKPFREVDAAIIRFLTADECRRLANACGAGGFRDMVNGALLTGCRYGELARLRVGDFNRQAATVVVATSKSGKPRFVALSDEGVALLTGLAAGRGPRELMFRRDDGGAWGPSQQQRPIAEASRQAKLDPPATFHVLRHTYASALAMRGVPMGAIAAQLGHIGGTRTTEKHYAHLAPSYVADVVRASMPALGIVEVGNVTPLRPTEANRGAA